MEKFYGIMRELTFFLCLGSSLLAGLFFVVFLALFFSESLPRGETILLMLEGLAVLVLATVCLFLADQALVNKIRRIIRAKMPVS